MTIITPTGITGINSITSSGSTLVFQSASGTSPIVTGLDNISSAGVITATRFVGNLTGNVNSTGVSTIATLNVTQSNLTNLNVSGISTFAAGSVSAPSISPSGDSNTGIFFPSSDTIAFAEGGVEALRINSSGYIGIGTDNPGNKLDVVDNVNNTFGQLRMQSSSSFGTRMTFASTSTNGKTYQIGSNFAVGQGEFSIYDYTSALERLRVDSSGRVTMPYQPCFYCDLNNNGLNFGFASGSVVPFSSATTNVGSNFNTSTYRFVAPIAGNYVFHICLSFGNNAANNTWVAGRFRKNGSVLLANNYILGQVSQINSNQYDTIAGTAILNLAVNDYIDVIAEYNTFNGNLSFGNFCGFLLG